jgi:hypothetical protein
MSSRDEKRAAEYLLEILDQLPAQRSRRDRRNRAAIAAAARQLAAGAGQEAALKALTRTHRSRR